jgi:O-antigen/teichoic acid export membrane protein
MADANDPIFEIDADTEPTLVPELGVVIEPQPVAAPVAVETKNPSVFFLVSSLVGGNLISTVLRTIGGLLQARCIARPLYDLFCSIGLVYGYIPFAQLGILNGMNRELPYFIGKGDRQRVNELAAAAQAWSLLLGVTVGVGLLGVGLWQLLCCNLLVAAGWFTYAVLAFLLFYNTNYLQMTYRTGHDFARLAMASVAENAVALAAVGLVVLLNFYGMCLRALISAVVSVAILHYWRPFRIGPRWNLQHLKHLLAIGFPIFIVGQIYAYWTTLNATLVLCYLGQDGMGPYTIAVMAGGALELLPAAVGQVLYPRMAEQYGRTGRVRDLVQMSIKPTILSVVGVALCVAVAWPLVEPVTRLILPAYVDTVPAIRWYLLVPLVQSFLAINNVYNVVRRQDLYLTAILLGMGAYVTCLMWLVRNGAKVELEMFPQAMLAGRAVFALMCYVMMIVVVQKRPETK